MKQSTLALGTLAGALAIALASFQMIDNDLSDVTIPETVRIEAGSFEYRPAGDFRIETRLVDAPLDHRTAQRPIEIMKYHVTQADYKSCVTDGACNPSSGNASASLPQVDVSFVDAKAYAAWLSERSGQSWRLPTDAEWVRAAGDRFQEVILGDISNSADPSKLWLRQYSEEAAKRGSSDPALRPVGSYGENNLGVADINGNVWEWTVGCQTNGQVSTDGQRIVNRSDYCGVRIAQGKHRAYIIDFVRDAKSGGCAVGIPPDNLGIRLVRDL